MIIINMIHNIFIILLLFLIFMYIYSNPYFTIIEGLQVNVDDLPKYNKSKIQKLQDKINLIKNKKSLIDELENKNNINLHSLEAIKNKIEDKANKNLSKTDKLMDIKID